MIYMYILLYGLPVFVTLSEYTVAFCVNEKHGGVQTEKFDTFIKSPFAVVHRRTNYTFIIIIL